MTKKLPPQYVDLNETEVAQLLLRKNGFTKQQVTIPPYKELRATLSAHGIEFTRRAVLLRSFREGAK